MYVVCMYVCKYVCMYVCMYNFNKYLEMHQKFQFLVC